MLQAALPFVLMVVPMLASTIVVAIGTKDVSDILLVNTFMLSWLPVLNPLLALYYVESYRNALLLRRENYRITPNLAAPDIELNHI